MQVKVGFLINQIDNRGTGNAVFNYAHYNEVILGNQSKIFTLPSANHDQGALEVYADRFGGVYIPHGSYLGDIDCLYHIKSGEDDGFRPDRNIPYLVHSVFHPTRHGDRFAVISEWMSQRDGFPFVPHIVELPNDTRDFRAPLGIADDLTVFGRHGGFDSFDIDWVWDAIQEVLAMREDIYFLFVNTPIPIKHPRIIGFPGTTDRHLLKVFINTCDAMLHARTRGETFGIAVGEFASNRKQIFTYGGSYEKAHLYELRGTALTYNNQSELVLQMLAYKREPAHPFYDRFTPHKVMEKFNEVFLNDL